jgi:hypothetical protein
MLPRLEICTNHIAALCASLASNPPHSTTLSHPIPVHNAVSAHHGSRERLCAAETARSVETTPPPSARITAPPQPSPPATHLVLMLRVQIGDSRSACGLRKLRVPLNRATLLLPTQQRATPATSPPHAPAPHSVELVKGTQTGCPLECRKCDEFFLLWPLGE